MDLTRLEINRRTALLTSAAIAANVINPMRAFAQETPRKGGVFNVHYGAEQRQLNPSIQASTGVYIIGGKIQENLVDLDASGQPVGVLAESWEASPDGRSRKIARTSTSMSIPPQSNSHMRERYGDSASGRNACPPNSRLIPAQWATASHPANTGSRPLNSRPCATHVTRGSSRIAR